MPAKAAPKKNPSALKRNRQTEKRELRNQSTITKIKTFTKKFETTLDSKNKEGIQKALNETIRVIGSAASKGVIHKNTASRKISRLTRKANTFSA